LILNIPLTSTPFYCALTIIFFFFFFFKVCSISHNTSSHNSFWNFQFLNRFLSIVSYPSNYMPNLLLLVNLLVYIFFETKMVWVFFFKKNPKWNLLTEQVLPAQEVLEEDLNFFFYNVTSQNKTLTEQQRKKITMKQLLNIEGD